MPATARGALPFATLVRIVRAEDERRWEESDLGALLSDKSAAVRQRAAMAAGRIGDAGAIEPLAALLRRDRDERVRAAAAFAIGEIEQGAGADALLETLRLSKTEEVRARTLEALGKIAAALPEAQGENKKRLGAAIVDALEAEHRLAKPSRGVVLMGLTAALRARHERAPQAVALFLTSPDARVRADAANTLTRLRAKVSLEQLRTLLTHDADAIVRANAARALGAAEDAQAVDALAARAVGDTDERVRTSALRSLALLKEQRVGAQLVRRAGELLAAYRKAREAAGNARPSETNELLEIAATLGRLYANSNNEQALEVLSQLRQAGVAAPEVEVALARIAPSRYLRDEAVLKATARTTNRKGLAWQTISAFGQGLGEVANITSVMGGNSYVSLQADAQIMLRTLIEDSATPALAMPDLLNALAAFKPADLGAVMRSKLTADDPIVRATAADTLGGLAPDEETTRALIAALPRALSEEMNDAALSILSALAKQKSAQATEAIRGALEVPDYVVRRRAVALLNEGGSGDSGRVETVATRNRAEDYERALARTGKRVRAVVETDKGAFTIELLPDDAPLTVDNFVQLARRRFFDNLSFHRVVPNFVIQGGDPRGDGNGGPGYQIRCEINTVPYGRGAVGMALSGKDTGGSQWFVTHSPQPHLDGGYTVFGRVTEGLEVVDRITRGDLIRSVTVTETARPQRAESRTQRAAGTVRR